MPQDVIQTTVTLPLALWRQVRYRAADEQTSLNALVRRALEQTLKREGGEGPASR